MNTAGHPFNADRLTAEQRDIDRWYYVNPQCLSADAFDFFMRCRNGVQMLLDGASGDEIRGQTGFTPRLLRKRLKRAFEVAPDGELVGQRTFLPRVRLRAYTRRAARGAEHGVGYAGAFRQLLREHPRIEQVIILYYFRHPKKGVIHESHIRIKSVLKRFLEACREAGLGPNDYPFTTRRLGYEALRRFCRSLHGRYFKEAAAGFGGISALKRAQTSEADDKPLGSLVPKPYQRVELDVHTIDAIWTFIVNNTPSGMPAQVTLDRIYAIVIVEPESRARLGYHLCLHNRPRYEDVLACMGKAVRPWVRRTLTVEGLQYHEKAGFPSGVLPKFSWALWQELHFDRDWSNLANDCRHAAMRYIGCQIIVGEGRTPNRRPFIERTFAQLESAGFHRMPNTMGAHPKDPKRNEPEHAARHFEMTYQQLEECFEVMLANDNATPTEGIEWRSPLEYLGYFDTRDDFVVGHVPPEQQVSFTLNKRRVSVRVRGNVKQGKRPFVELDRAHYSSSVLKKLPGLIGKEIEVEVDQDPLGDYRFLRAFLSNGHDLGLLTVKGPWARVRHSLAERKLVNRLRDRGLLYYAENQDPVQALLDALGAQIAKSGKKKAGKGGIRRAKNLYADLAGRESTPRTDRSETEEDLGHDELSVLGTQPAAPKFNDAWEGLQ